MKINHLFPTGKPLLSFEFFPPKSEEGFANLYTTIEALRPIHPSYVSVTYGAGGSTRQKTVDLTSRIQRELGIRAMAHLTCVGHTASEIGAILDTLWAGGVQNVLALRGDPPNGQKTFVAAEGGFPHATDLVAYVKSRQDFCVGVAGYPEGHPECLNATRDVEHLKAKVDRGANFIVSQLFFDNQDFYRWRDQARAMGIRVPIIAGIMPILNVSQIKRFIALCGAKIPHPLLLEIERVEEHPQAVHAAGVAHAIRQCQDLLDHGAEGIHFYTLNKSQATVEICRALRLTHAY